MEIITIKKRKLLFVRDYEFFLHGKGGGRATEGGRTAQSV